MCVAALYDIQFAARDVLSPPSEQDILERFSRVELSS